MEIKFKKKFHSEAIRFEPSKWFDDAIIGTTKNGLLIYSYYRLVRVNMVYMNETEEDSIDWIDYNLIQLTFDSNPVFRVSMARKYIWKEYKPSFLKRLRKRK